MIPVLFPLGVRLSTIVTAAIFVGAAAARRDRRFLVAGWVWLSGFEAVFQVASLLLDRLPLGLPGPIFFVVLGSVSVWVTRRTVRPDLRYLAVAVALVVVWMATGFHLNGHQHGMFSLHPRIAHFDPLAEALNDVAKTLWAAAYLLPLWRGRRSPVPQAGAADGRLRRTRAIIPGQ